jgi:hypothetical protein
VLAVLVALEQLAHLVPTQLLHLFLPLLVVAEEGVVQALLGLLEVQAAVLVEIVMVVLVVLQRQDKVMLGVAELLHQNVVEVEAAELEQLVQMEHQRAEATAVLV